eukprot:gene3932-4481_t
MPDYCVVYGCNNENNKESKGCGISLHKIPFYGDKRPPAVKKRKLWANFVKMKRDKWQPTKYSVVCSEHFKPDDFETAKMCVPGFQKCMKAVMKRDELGVTAVPSIQTFQKNQDQAASLSRPDTSEKSTTRQRRQVLREISKSATVSFPKAEHQENLDQSHKGVEEIYDGNNFAETDDADHSTVDDTNVDANIMCDSDSFDTECDDTEMDSDEEYDMEEYVHSSEEADEELVMLGILYTGNTVPCNPLTWEAVPKQSNWLHKGKE